jgi:hypothetical protein
MFTLESVYNTTNFLGKFENRCKKAFEIIKLNYQDMLTD